MSYSEVFCDGKDHNGDPIVFGDDLSKKLFVEKCGGKYEEDLYTTEMCSNFDQSNSVCLQFHQQFGFQNLWIGFLILIAFCLLLCAFYSFFMCCKFSHLKHVIKWHIGIFLVNITIWFWVPSLIFNAICQTHLICGWYVFVIPLVAGCFIATILDLLCCVNMIEPKTIPESSSEQGQLFSQFSLRKSISLTPTFKDDMVLTRVSLIHRWSIILS